MRSPMAPRHMPGSSPALRTTHTPGRRAALLAAALVASLAACSTDDAASSGAPGESPAASASTTPTINPSARDAAIAQRPVEEGHNDADVAFAEEVGPLLAHHLALRDAMSGEAGLDMRVANLANEPVLERGHSLNAMNDLLAAWGAEPVPADEDPMPEGPAALAELSGEDRSEEYLRLTRANNERVLEIVEGYLPEGRNSAMLGEADTLQWGLGLENTDIDRFLETY